MLALLVVSMLAGAPRGEVSAPVPQTALQISLTVPGFRADPRLAAELEQRAPGSVVLAGRIDPNAAALDVSARRNHPVRTSEQWRSELSGEGGEAFAHGGIACRELEVPLSESESNFLLEAFVVAGGSAFELRVVTFADAKTARLSRSDFTKLVDSFRVAFVRYGEPAALPREARDAMHRALVAWPQWRRTLENELAAKRDDANIAFALGELHVFSRSMGDEVLSAHRRALAGFEKLRTPSPEQRFAWMLSEHAIGVVLCGSKPAEALVHLRKGYEIAAQMRAPARADLAYALARALAATGEPTEAVRMLDEAISSSPALRDAAREDEGFRSLAADKRFQALTRAGR